MIQYSKQCLPMKKRMKNLIMDLQNQNSTQNVQEECEFTTLTKEKSRNTAFTFVLRLVSLVSKDHVQEVL